MRVLYLFCFVRTETCANVSNSTFPEDRGDPVCNATIIVTPINVEENSRRRLLQRNRITGNNSIATGTQPLNALHLLVIPELYYTVGNIFEEEEMRGSKRLPNGCSCDQLLACLGAVNFTLAQARESIP